MLEIFKYILILSIGFIVVKLCFSFVIAFFTFTLGAFLYLGALVAILAILRIIEPDTAWTIVEWAVGIGLFFDLLKFLRSPGRVFSDMGDILNSSSDSGGSSGSSPSNSEKEYPYNSDQYRKCCGSCRWLSGHSSSNDICTLHGREVNHSDSCGDWQVY